MPKTFVFGILFSFFRRQNFSKYTFSATLFIHFIHALFWSQALVKGNTPES